jgi:hypothetical protein
MKENNSIREQLLALSPERRRELILRGMAVRILPDVYVTIGGILWCRSLAAAESARKFAPSARLVIIASNDQLACCEAGIDPQVLGSGN